MKVSELGEFGLISRLAEILATKPPAEVAGRLTVGIGDDAAVWRTTDRDATGAQAPAVVATTDSLVSGVHFLADRTPWDDLGWKAIAVNVSDIAAMGATPEFALVTLALPPDTEVADIDKLYEGLAEAAETSRLVIAGGDIVKAPCTIISVTVIGRAEVDATGEPAVLRRDAAREGDLIAVTGSLGGSAGGLRALQEELEGTEPVLSMLRRHLRPQARVNEGRAAISAGLRCAIDVSDGFLQDLGRVCVESRLGAVVWRDKVPVDPAAIECFGAEEALRLAVAGGEDYELIVTGSRARIDETGRSGSVPITVVGEMVIEADHRAKLLDEGGREVPLSGAGWDHLREQR